MERSDAERSALFVGVVVLSSAEPKCYPDSLRTSAQAVYRELPKSQSRVSDFKSTYRLAKNSFTLPGLGESGENCMSLRASDFAVNDRAVRYRYLKCKRVECPKCWADWARRRIFDIVMRIEAYAKVFGVRPCFVVASVPPMWARTWNWGRLNDSLFRRFYRRGKEIGLVGGYSFFHPFRLKLRIKKRLRDLGWGSGVMDSGYWKGVREDCLDLGSPSSYYRFSPHLHSIVFGDPKEHKCKDFVIRFKDKGGKPVEMDMEAVIGYSFYLISHVGVGRHFQTRVTRSWGVLYDLDPRDLLSEKEFNELAGEVAECVGMVWDPVEGVLVYEDDSDRDYDWVSVWRLGEYLNDSRYEGWRSELAGYYKEFLEILWAKTWVLRYPPPLEEMLEDHEFYGVAIVCERIPSERSEAERRVT